MTSTIDALLHFETDGRHEADARRTIRDERLRLQHRIDELATARGKLRAAQNLARRVTKNTGPLGHTARRDVEEAEAAVVNAARLVHEADAEARRVLAMWTEWTENA